MKKFRVIVADPPWPYPPPKQSGRFRRDNPNWKPSRTGWFWEGDVMTVDAIGDIDVPSLADSCLFLWCPSSIPHIGLQILERWGFKVKTTFVWAKTTKDGNVRTTGLGYWSFSVHELLFFGIKGGFKRDTVSAQLPSVFYAPSPKGEARKPDSIYESIAKAYVGPRLEMFATSKRRGYTAHGRV